MNLIKSPLLKIEEFGNELALTFDNVVLRIDLTPFDNVYLLVNDVHYYLSDLSV